MNSCLQKPCQRGFAYLDHPTIPIQIDFSGAFRYVWVNEIYKHNYKTGSQRKQIGHPLLCHVTITGVEL